MNCHKTKLRRILIDMHIPDWNDEFLSNFSPEYMAELMHRSGTEVAQFSGSSCLGLCFWPTKVGYPHRCLNGRDLMGETLHAYREQGLSTQIFLNTWNRAAYDHHPEWRMIFENGLGSVDAGYDNGRFGLCCPNTGYGDFFIELLREVVPLYETDGYWIDMVGWWNVICHCPDCRAKFGRSIPAKIDWNDFEWNSFVKFREETLNSFVKKIYDTIDCLAPERTVAFQTGALHMGWSGGGNTPDFYRCGDYLAHDLTGEKFEQIYCSKMYTALSRKHPVEFMVSRCIHLSHHTTNRPLEELSSIALSAVANQTSFTLIDALDPFGTLDERFYDQAAQVFHKYGTYEKYVKASSVPVADCAIYYSKDSQMEVRVSCSTAERALAASRIPRRFANIARALSEKHILFSFADVETDLYRFPALILSDCCRLDESECTKIRQYVADGGKIYASADSSLYDPAQGIRKDFALADVFGVHTDGKITQKVTYIAPTETASPLSSYCRRTSPVMLEGAQTMIVNATAEVLGTLTLPCSDPAEKNRFGSAISNPPCGWTNAPALTRHRYGKGEALYCAGRLEENEYQFQRNVFADFVGGLSGTMIQTDAAPWVEVTLFDLPEENRLLLSFLNKPTDLPPAPLFGIETVIRLPKHYQLQKILLAPEETEIPSRKKENGIVFKLRKLEEFTMVLIAYSPNK